MMWWQKFDFRMLDLYSGLGGASDSMILDSKWEVQRIENNHALNFVPFTTFMCVKKLAAQIEKQINYKSLIPIPIAPSTQITLIWASPPCREFSQGFNAPGAIANRAGIDFNPNLDLVYAAKKIIHLLQPKYWCIENVVGSIKHLTPILGKPRMIVGSYVLYGNFPLFEVSDTFPSKADKDVWSTDPLRANKKAKVPYEVSDALREAIETQTSIMEWMPTPKSND